MKGRVGTGPRAVIRGKRAYPVAYLVVTEVQVGEEHCVLQACRERQGAASQGGKRSGTASLQPAAPPASPWPGQQPPVSFIGRSTKNISANDLIWEFFEKHPMK